MIASTLRLSSTQEPTLEASKWLKCPVLLDVEEMRSLLQALAPFTFYHCGAVCPRGQGTLSNEVFLEHYKQYIDKLKAGLLPDHKSYQAWFSSVMSAIPEALFAIPVGEDRQLVRIYLPVVQMQAHHFDYSTADQKFRSMVFGSDNITWGIQFSYPQLYRDPKTKVVEKANNPENAPNSQLFATLQKWMRQHTIPTPFVVGDFASNEPIRLGKQCLPWINNHPQLIKKGIKVEPKKG